MKARTNAALQTRGLTPTAPQIEVEFFSAVLAILDGQVPALPDDHPYAGAVAEIQAGIATGGSPERASVSAEVMEAVRAFVNAEDWEATRRVVEAHQALLFRSEVETLFEQNVEQARAGDDQDRAERLQLHLALLRDCKANGIAAAFARLQATRQEEALPFDAGLIPGTIAALLGGPQEKMAHARYLADQLAHTGDEQVKALISAIQMALFGGDLAQLGGELSGVYRRAWEAIVAGVGTEGVDPRLLAVIAQNTPAVLGPAADRRDEWRGQLVDIRSQATAQGQRQLAQLVDAVVGLLDASGNPAGLGTGLAGIFAQTWQAIVEQL